MLLGGGGVLVDGCPKKIPKIFPWRLWRRCLCVLTTPGIFYRWGLILGGGRFKMGVGSKISKALLKVGGCLHIGKKKEVV